VRFVVWQIASGHVGAWVIGVNPMLYTPRLAAIAGSSPNSCQRSLTVCLATLRSLDLVLEYNSSIGLRSGLYGGKYSIVAPTPSKA
jgi:hypothetical protein